MNDLTYIIINSFLGFLSVKKYNNIRIYSYKYLKIGKADNGFFKVS